MKYCEICHSAYPNDFQVCPRDEAALRSTSEIIEGLVIANKYCVLEKVGSGGMATVYRAKHLAFSEIRAIKVINSRLQDETLIKRFKTEAIIARKLQHPHAVRIDDLDVTEDGRPFIVMEYVEGKSLRKTIRERGELPIARSLHIAAQVAEALGAAHELGVTHRDIKPDNILLTRHDGNSDFVKVLDFGIAKVREGAIEMGDDNTPTPTQTGMVVGTPAYISPEQARGKKDTEVDGRADLYALGVVLFEMITGKLPFESETSMGMILHHLHTPVTPAHKLRPELHIPSSVSMLLMKAMQKDRDERFQSAEEMLQALRDPEAWARLQPRWRRDEHDDNGVMLTGVRGSENYEILPSQMGSVIASERDTPLRDTPQAGEDAARIGRPFARAGDIYSDELTPLPMMRRMAGSKRRTGGSHSGAWATLLVLLLLGGSGAAYLHRRPDYRQLAVVKLRSGYGNLQQRFAKPNPAPIAAEQKPAVAPPASLPSPDAVATSVPGIEAQAAPDQAPAVPVPPIESKTMPLAPGASPANSPPQETTTATPPVLTVAANATSSAAIKASASLSGPGQLHGVVYDAQRQPAPEITVELENTALGFDQATTTDSEGKYSFSAVPSGRGYLLSAIKDGDAQDSRSIVIRGGENRAISPPLKLAGEQEASTNVRLYGKVYDAAGQPVSGASVKLENPKLQVSRGAVISSDGNYSFTEVPPGDGYKISVVRDGNTLESRSGLTVDPAKVNPDQVLLLYLKSH